MQSLFSFAEISHVLWQMNVKFNKYKPAFVLELMRYIIPKTPHYYMDWKSPRNVIL